MILKIIGICVMYSTLIVGAAHQKKLTKDAFAALDKNYLQFKKKFTKFPNNPKVAAGYALAGMMIAEFERRLAAYNNTAATQEYLSTISDEDRRAQAQRRIHSFIVK